MRIERIRKNDFIPGPIEKEINRRKKEEFYESFLHGDDLYLVASLGQKNTAGYDVYFENIRTTSHNEIEVQMNKIEPEKGGVQSQVITTPFTVLKVLLKKDGKFPKRVIFKNNNGEVLKGIDIQKITK